MQHKLENTHFSNQTIVEMPFRAKDGPKVGQRGNRAILYNCMMRFSFVVDVRRETANATR